MSSILGSPSLAPLSSPAVSQISIGDGSPGIGETGLTPKMTELALGSSTKGPLNTTAVTQRVDVPMTTDEKVAAYLENLGGSPSRRGFLGLKNEKDGTNNNASCPKSPPRALNSESKTSPSINFLAAASKGLKSQSSDLGKTIRVAGRNIIKSPTGASRTLEYSASGSLLTSAILGPMNETVGTNNNASSPKTSQPINFLAAASKGLKSQSSDLGKTIRVAGRNIIKSPTGASRTLEYSASGSPSTSANLELMNETVGTNNNTSSPKSESSKKAPAESVPGKFKKGLTQSPNALKGTNSIAKIIQKSPPGASRTASKSPPGGSRTLSNSSPRSRISRRLALGKAPAKTTNPEIMGKDFIRKARFSQITVSSYNHNRDESIHSLATDLLRGFNKQGALDVVRQEDDKGDEIFTSLDNRRLLCVKRILNVTSEYTIFARIHDSKEPLPKNQVRRFQLDPNTEHTWGDALNTRLICSGLEPPYGTKKEPTITSQQTQTITAMDSRGRPVELLNEKDRKKLQRKRA